MTLLDVLFVTSLFNVSDIFSHKIYNLPKGWRSGRASDSESRGPGFDPHKRHRVVSLSNTH